MIASAALIVVSHSAQPSSSRTRYAFIQPCLVSWIRFSVTSVRFIVTSVDVELRPLGGNLTVLVFLSRRFLVMVRRSEHPSHATGSVDRLWRYPHLPEHDAGAAERDVLLL